LHGHVRELHLTAAGQAALLRADPIVATLEDELVALVGHLEPAVARALEEIAENFPPARAD
jgi:hypothetical protein